MKEPIEELFKKSLENHELPFNEAAWSAMNARLDVVKPTGGGRGGNLLKYVAVATGITIISVATFLYLSDGKELTQDQLKATNTLTEDNDAPTTSNAQSQHSTTGNTQKTENNTPAAAVATQTPSSTQTPSTATSQPSTPRATSGAGSGDISNIEHKPFGTLGGINSGESFRKPVEFHPADENGMLDPSLTPANEMIVPIITGKCVGEEFEVNNVNKRYIVILDAAGNRMRIPSKSKRTFAIDQAGDYTYGFFVDCKFNE